MCSSWSQVSDSEIKWSMSRLPVFPRMLDAACLAAKAGAQQAVVSDANTVSNQSDRSGHRRYVRASSVSSRIVADDGCGSLASELVFAHQSILLSNDVAHAPQP